MAYRRSYHLMSSDESRLRALEQSVDSLVYHIKNIMEDSPSALEKATLLVKLLDLQKLVEDFKEQKKGR
tara:strand:+ start:8 stop:214 length:207 start_codon:yes stop_codon:yes gene_type:complete